MSGVVTWIIRGLVMVAWFALIVTLVPAALNSDWFTFMPDLALYFLNLFIVPTVFAIVTAADVSAFVVRRFNV